MARITKPVEERKQEIIDVAKAMFLEIGYEKTQMADISRRMNVASGLLYHYFKSKTEILYTVIDQLIQERESVLQAENQKYPGTAAELIKVVFMRNQQIDEDSDEKRLMAGLPPDPAIMQYCVQRIAESARLSFTSLIERGNADGSWLCDDPPMTAAFIIGGASALMEFCGFLTPEDQEIEKITRMILRILDTT
jgi:AcrR family transcriptional regulator